MHRCLNDSFSTILIMKDTFWHMLYNVPIFLKGTNLSSLFFDTNNYTSFHFLKRSISKVKIILIYNISTVLFIVNTLLKYFTVIYFAVTNHLRYMQPSNATFIHNVKVSLCLTKYVKLLNEWILAGYVCNYIKIHYTMSFFSTSE